MATVTELNLDQYCAEVAARAKRASMELGTVSRKTKETDIEVSVNLDGTGVSDAATGIGFFDHMLDLLARHSRIDIKVKATGDLHVDHQHGRPLRRDPAGQTVDGFSARAHGVHE